MPCTVALVSLGCPKNLVDSEVMLGLLQNAGYEVVEEVTEAEVVIVNTCAFIEPAVEEAVEALLDLVDLKREGSARCVICAGCLPERYRERLQEEIPEVDGFLGPGSVAEVVEVVERCLAGERSFRLSPVPWLYRYDTPRLRSGAQWLAHVKIADGCSHRCSYCMIPSLRGPYRSRGADDVRAEIRGLIAEDVREICLIAQDTSAWGRDLEGDWTLARLLESLDLGGWDGWIRLQYLHPDGISDEMIAAVAAVPQVVPYFDIPLQHAAGSVLRSMGRRGDPEAYLEMIGRIRGAIPEAALRTTFIVGYPGETDEDFERLLEFVREARFDRLSAFQYWPEEGTRAAEQEGQVPQDVALDRLDELMLLQHRISLEINESFVGGGLRVLIEQEGEAPTEYAGRSYRDAPQIDGEVVVEAAGRQPQPGEFIVAEVIEAAEHDLRATYPGT